MCFNSSSSSSQQKQTTISRDERQAADNGATVVSAKDSGTATTTVAEAQTAHTVLSAAPDAVVNYQDLTPEVLGAVFNYAQGVGQGAADFAQQTQQSYQAAVAKANTQDATQIVQELMLLAAGVFVVYFVFVKGA